MTITQPFQGPVRCGAIILHELPSFRSKLHLIMAVIPRRPGLKQHHVYTTSACVEPSKLLPNLVKLRPICNFARFEKLLVAPLD